MRLARALGFTGRLFIWIGSLVLLFVAYQLWGTGIAEARAQNSLENDFEAQLDDLGLDFGVLDDLETAAPTTTAAAAPVETTTTLPLPPPEDGDAIARIVIPAIDVDKYVVEGVGRADLREGPGHYPDTPMPGQPGNSAIAGHRTTYGAPFHRVDELEVGDEIYVATFQGLFRYVVSGTEIVRPSDVEVIEDKGDNRLTLTSCHPKYSARQRIIITATLDDTPAPPPPTTTTVPDEATTPEGLAGDEDGDGVEDGVTDDTPATTIADEGDDGLGLESLDAGEATSYGGAVAWGAVLLAVWLAGWQLSSRWKKWPGIAIAAVPFVVVMLIFFDATTRALPANF